MISLRGLITAAREALWLARDGNLRVRVQYLEDQIQYLVRHIRANVEVHGHRIRVDPVDSLCLVPHGIYEVHETALIQQTVKRGDVVVDIGANIGYYTLLLAKLVGDEGKVFAFEPDPTNFALLESNVVRNGYCNVVLERQAVAARTGRHELYLATTNDGDHRLYDSGDGRRSVAVDSVALDDYFHDYQGRIDFIKMDIQGAEQNALHGMTHLLQQQAHVKLLTEFWPIGLKRGGGSATAYLNALRALGFRLHQIPDRGTHPRPVRVDELLRAWSSDRDEHTNLLCVRDGEDCSLSACAERVADFRRNGRN
jgi:FkbM family methyltransferase